MKKIIIVIFVLALVAAGTYVYTNKETLFAKSARPTEQALTPPPPSMATTTNEVVDKTKTVLGKSAGGTDITAFHYGEGDKEVVFVGGIHGGYEWNTSLLAYELMDFLAAQPTAIPANIKVTVIPVLNPDGLSKVVDDPSLRFTAADITETQAVQISGRANGDGVDLNRNFDCDWQAKGTWRNTQVSGGTAAFSEPEAQAFKAYIERTTPEAVVVWFSSAGGVYSASCDDGVSPANSALTNAYAKAAGYPAHEDFTSYTVTGDVTNWLAKIGIPSTSVLLTNHQDTEWTKNQKGIQAVLTHVAK
jgi:hypothetical protein